MVNKREGLRSGVARRASARRAPPFVSSAEAFTVQVGTERYVVSSAPAPGEHRGNELSPAERFVMVLLLAGQSNAEIGRARGTSARTIANQVASLFKKLDVGSRAELAAREALVTRART